MEKGKREVEKSSEGDPMFRDFLSATAMEERIYRVGNPGVDGIMRM